MKVLIVGGSGFLGAELVRQAVGAGWETAATYWSRPGGDSGASWYELDLRSAEFVDELLAEVAPAAVIDATSGYSDWSVTADGSIRLAIAAVARGCRLVHVSSDAVFSGARVHYDETCLPDPVTPYGAAKAVGATSLGAMAAHGAAKVGGANVSASTLVLDGVGALPFGKFASAASKGVKVGPHGDLMMKGANVFNKVADASGGVRPTLTAGKFARFGGADDVAHFKPTGIADRAKLAWTAHVAQGSETSLKGQLLGMPLTKGPLSELPSIKAAIRADGTLDPMSWWSRGPQAALGARTSIVRGYESLQNDAPAAGTG
ncbi:sugar nucleotide-binding protein [Streptomyces sp. HNM0575]|uniref:sugar nucleotide-binding protein n=1 Tax=Streptomyces sp. HNM0575 TaxID=2716338 RepID=UPI00145DCC1C|nr:sugar nucleotide-binding protein [Streptomyces sp. HNM0575]NLU71148.1 sugar nucleotide-binding protein [Streptomyces sp. HNM0575]